MQNVLFSYNVNALSVKVNCTKNKCKCLGFSVR